MQDKVLLYIRPGTSRQEINQNDERKMSKDNCTMSTPPGDVEESEKFPRVNQRVLSLYVKRYFTIVLFLY